MDSREGYPAPHRNAAIRLLGLWFGVSQPVRPWPYALSGLGLMTFKYAVEAAVVWWFTSLELWPWEFLNPVMSFREPYVRAAGDWLAWAWILWSLPFLWIATSMSIRRAADAGQSPWVGLTVLVPLVNLLIMPGLALSPSRPQPPADAEPLAPDGDSGARHAAIGIAVAIMVGGVMMLVSVYLFSSYGGSLFLGTPLLMGATAAYYYNQPTGRSWGLSVGVGVAAVMFACAALLLFALEGVICVIMALPLLVPLGAMGGRWAS